MKTEHTVYCSGPECVALQRVSQSTWEAGRLPEGWSRLETFGVNGTRRVEAFCHTDCAMRWCATQTPQLSFWLP
jgi:hypothetical protein